MDMPAISAYPSYVSGFGKYGVVFNLFQQGAISLFMVRLDFRHAFEQLGDFHETLLSGDTREIRVH